MTINDISNKVIGCALKVHNELGPGLLESAYKECINYVLIQQGFIVEKEKPMPIVFRDVKLDYGYRIDLLVENQLVIEVKSVDFLSDLHLAQILTYMKLGGFDLGLLINFNVSLLKQGIKRVVNNFDL